MNESGFWQAIRYIDLDSLSDCDDEGAVEPLVEYLSNLTEDEIKDFENILSTKLYEIDGRVYADNAGESGMSGDGFLYARCYVVANGQEFYNNVKTAPENMSDSIDNWCEALLEVAPWAWSEVTGNDEEEWDNDPPVSYETGSNKDLWD